MTSTRPDRTSMEGMIWNANHVLEAALSPGMNGIPKEMFGKAIAICVVSVVEAGFIFSGNVGTGILLRRIPTDGDDAGPASSWSPPVAMGLTGVGWGFLVGGQIKETITFVFDEMSLDGMLGDVGVKFGAQAALTAGPFGRTYDVSLGLSNKGAAGTVTVALSKGLFGGLNVEGAALGPRSSVNDNFYGMATTPRSIAEGGVTMPVGKPTLINEVYEKLNKLSAGQTYEPSPDEAARVASLRVSAQLASEEANRAADVVHVNAEAEAAKE